MRAAIFVFALLALCAAQQTYPAVRITSNVTDLNRWFADHLNVLSYVDMPLPEQSWKFLGIGLFKADNLRLRNVSAEEIKVEAEGNNRLRFTVTKSVLTVDFHTKIGLVSSSGEVHFNNNSVSVVLQLDGDATGKPIVSIEDLKITLGVFQLKLNIGHSLWSVINTAIPLIRSWVESEIPKYGVPFANKLIQQQLETIGTVIPIDPSKRVSVDISFFSRPIITDTRVQIEIKGLPYVNGAVHQCPYLYGQPYQGNNDVMIFTDVNFINCMTSAIGKGDILNEFLSNFTIPAPLSEPLSLGVKLYGDETVLKFKKDAARGTVRVEVSLFRSAKPDGNPYVVLGLNGNAGIDLSFEGSNFTALTIHGYLEDIASDLAILKFNGDQRGLSADLKALAKQTALLDELVNQHFVQVIPIPFPSEFSSVPLAAAELFETYSLKVVDSGFYVGIDFRV